MRAIPVEVFRHSKGDFTNGGISSRFSSLLVVCDQGWINIDENNKPANLCKLVKRHLFGRDVFHVEPIDRPSGAGWMMGGNYCATCDSRFSQAIEGMYGAVAIHDRQESQELYEILSM